jgi:hypothetical protein
MNLTVVFPAGWRPSDYNVNPPKYVVTQSSSLIVVSNTNGVAASTPFSVTVTFTQQTTTCHQSSGDDTASRIGAIAGPISAVFGAVIGTFLCVAFYSMFIRRKHEGKPRVFAYISRSFKKCYGDIIACFSRKQHVPTKSTSENLVFHPTYTQPSNNLQDNIYEPPAQHQPSVLVPNTDSVLNSYNYYNEPAPQFNMQPTVITTSVFNTLAPSHQTMYPTLTTNITAAELSAHPTTSSEYNPESYTLPTYAWETPKF